MTFDEKREQILLAKDIGKILDEEGSEEERAALLRRIEATGGGHELLEQMSKDNTILQKAVAAPVPDESMARFEALIEKEFAKREGPAPRHAHASWTGVLTGARNPEPRRADDDDGDDCDAADDVDADEGDDDDDDDAGVGNHSRP